LRVHFLGYRLPPRVTKSVAGPILRYELDLPDGRRATFAETVSPLTTDAAIGVLREIEVRAPAGAVAYLHCAQKAQALMSHSETAPAAGPPWLSFHDELGSTLLVVRGSPPQTTWQTAATDGAVVLAIPIDAVDGAARVTLVILRPKDASPEALKRVVDDELMQRRPAQ
jgi:hypothetical protein